MTWLLFARGVRERMNVNNGDLNTASNGVAYFSPLFINWTSSGLSHLPSANTQRTILTDLFKMCNLEGNPWKMWIGDYRLLCTYIFKWERLDCAGHSHPFPPHQPLHGPIIQRLTDHRLFHKKQIGAKTSKNLFTSLISLGRHLCKPQILGFYLSYCIHVSFVSFGLNAILCHIILIVFDAVWIVELSPDKVETSPDEIITVTS